MTKELEAFNNIMETYGNTNSLEGTYDDFLIIKKALTRLEQIEKGKNTDIIGNLMAFKNIEQANPSEALEQVKFFKSQDFYDEIGQHYGFIDERCEVIEQALIKAQEQKQVLKIIYEKNVDIEYIKLYNDYDDYCRGQEKYLIRKDLWLTKKEFELLKRYVDEQQVK